MIVWVSPAAARPCPRLCEALSHTSGRHWGRVSVVMVCTPLSWHQHVTHPRTHAVPTHHHHHPTRPPRYPPSRPTTPTCMHRRRHHLNLLFLRRATTTTTTAANASNTTKITPTLAPPQSTSNTTTAPGCQTGPTQRSRSRPLLRPFAGSAHLLIPQRHTISDRARRLGKPPMLCGTHLLLAQGGSRHRAGRTLRKRMRKITEAQPIKRSTLLALPQPFH